ncbi:MAG: ThiF family adenylyltransferase [Coriobacteriales bacterium]|nr:ThiF family adenylyltransferase [Coriobacteriales bacterium]
MSASAVPEWLSRNVPTLNPHEQELVARAKVCVVGCGGLGGFVCEFLVRLGVGSLVLIDGDVFCESNLNRQILATRGTLGASKAECAAERALSISPGLHVEAHGCYLDEDNAQRLVAGCDVVVDALDNAASRVVLERACELQGIPLVHGAVRGTLCQIAVIMPGERVLERLYHGHCEPPAAGTSEFSALKTTLSFTPALCASLEVAQALRIITGRSRVLGPGCIHYLNAQTLDHNTLQL